MLVMESLCIFLEPAVMLEHDSFEIRVMQQVLPALFAGYDSIKVSLTRGRKVLHSFAISPYADLLSARASSVPCPQLLLSRTCLVYSTE
jgi:hypothetical protein